MLIGQDLLRIDVPLPDIAYSLEAILFLGRVRSRMWLQGLVLRQSIVPWHPPHANSSGLSNSLRSFNLGESDI